MVKNLFLVLISFALLSCSKSDNQIPAPALDPNDYSDAEVLASIQDFQWRIFKQVCLNADQNENVLISPGSIISALYMALEGSDGSTREELLSGLALPSGQLGSTGPAYLKWLQDLRSTGDGVDLSMVNAIFYDLARVAPNDTFMQRLQHDFEAEESALDFDQAQSLEKINQWVSEETNDRIEEIIKEIKPDDIMFLINALHLKADWENPFAVELTQTADFTSSDGTVHPVNMMYQDVNDLRWFGDMQHRVVEKTFADTNYRMLFLQPTEPKDWPNFLSDLNIAKVNDIIIDKLQQGRILFFLPKFEVEYEKELSAVLKEMEMGEAFSPGQANFSRLGTAGGNIYLSRVQHKTFLAIDEMGAEGAAVTSVGVSVTSLPPTFRFDRPFVYIIRHVPSDSYLFIGKMEQP